MKPNNNAAHLLRPMLRALILVALFIGPLAGFAAASANEQSRDLKGAGFVLYVAMIR